MTTALATRLLKGWATASLVSMMCIASAQAHVMAAQQGTLNIVGDAAFMVLSVPVSAFTAVDDDGDGALSKGELAAHTGTVRQQLKEAVQLFQGAQNLPLQLLLIDVVDHDSGHEEHSHQLLVMGRFALAAEPEQAQSIFNQAHALRLHFNLFGRDSDEQAQNISITHQADAQSAHFTPERTSLTLFPSGLTRVLERVSQQPEQALLLLLAAGGMGLLMMRAWWRRQPAACHMHSNRSTEA